MTPTVKLKIVAEEIKEVLRRHDVAAALALHTPGHGEFVLHLNPSYSCVFMYEDDAIRINSKLENYASPEEQLQHQTNSSNMLRVLMELSAVNFQSLEGLSSMLDKKIGAVHE
jgi:hypothetical protein